MSPVGQPGAEIFVPGIDGVSIIPAQALTDLIAASASVANAPQELPK